MKRMVSSLLMVLMAALIFYGGAGVNLASYCCDDCRSHGMEVLIEDKCCEIHEHGHTEAVRTNNVCHTAADLDCTVERICFNWTSVHPLLLDLQPMAFQFFPVGLLSVQSPASFFLQLLSPLAGESPPPRCPRVYLSLLTSLLI